MKININQVNLTYLGGAIKMSIFLALIAQANRKDNRDRKTCLLVKNLDIVNTKYALDPT